jgi:hypothetical protein
MPQTGAWICWSTSRNSPYGDATGSNGRRVTARVRLQSTRDWLDRRRAELSRTRARQNGRGSNDAPHSYENDRPSGKFLAKLEPLMEDIQQVGCVTFARK